MTLEGCSASKPRPVEWRAVVGLLKLTWQNVIPLDFAVEFEGRYHSEEAMRMSESITVAFCVRELAWKEEGRAVVTAPYELEAK
jgi:hypothetical protein